MFNEQHKKESPILSLLGMGGGIGGGLVQGGSGGGGMDATGGTVYEDTSNNRKIHVFTFPNSDNFVVNSDPGSATLSVLCVGGGGGGGNYGGGGGAGSYVYVDDFPFSPGTYTVNVGDGGLAFRSASPTPDTYTNRRFINTQGAWGAPSTFGVAAGAAGAIGGPYPTNSIVAYGGGGGGGNSTSPVDAHHGVPRSGANQGSPLGNPHSVYFGSGGGASSQNTPTARGGGADYSPDWPTIGPTAIPALTRNNHFQNGGGAATQGLGQPVTNNTGAGGGGAGGAGSDPPQGGRGGAGGAGKAVPSTFLPSPYSWLPNPFLGIAQPSPDFNQFAGGGSGQSDDDTQVAGGSGGGGAGGGPGDATQGIDGRGGGGGGEAVGDGSEPGGNGVVIVSYPTA